MCPHSPPTPPAPSTSRPLTSRPPPTPVPRMTANTTSAPAAAPSVHSESARQLASLARAMLWPRAACRSACSGWPLRHVELQFFIRPDRRDGVPGVPIPTGSWPDGSSRDTRVLIASIACSYPEGVSIRCRATSAPPGSRTTPSIFVPPRSMPTRFMIEASSNADEAAMATPSDSVQWRYLDSNQGPEVYESSALAS